MLGADVVAVARAQGHEVAAYDRDHLDVTDPARVERTIARERPGAVINCAAWTNVDGAEESERDAEAAELVAGLYRGGHGLVTDPSKSTGSNR